MTGWRATQYIYYPAKEVEDPGGSRFIMILRAFSNSIGKGTWLIIQT